MSTAVSARERQLEENYEEAVFALMIYRMMSSEGEKLLAENSCPETGPCFRIPKDLDGKVIKSIEREFARKKRNAFFGTLSSAVTKAAVVFLVLAVMFAIPFSTVRAFRTAALTYVIEFFDKGVRIQTEPDDESPGQDTLSGTAEHTHPNLRWFPETEGGWELTSLTDEEDFFLCAYENAKGTKIEYEESIDSGAGYVFDTEDAVIYDALSVSGWPAFGAAKEDFVFVIWTDEVRKASCTLAVYGDLGQIGMDTVIRMAENMG